MLCIANWKMYGDLALVSQWSRGMRTACAQLGQNTTVVVCPPFPLLGVMQTALIDSPITLGAQDVDVHNNGAFTGQVSATMLLEQGCQYVLIGHSERRQYYGDIDALVRQKLTQSCQHGLLPVLCVGESLAVREQGKAVEFVTAQIDAAFAEQEPQSYVIAYEPIWAIGTGVHASPDDAEDMHVHIRSHIRQTYQNGHNAPILYGGSVKAGNAAHLLAKPTIDGVLVGGASLDAEQFATICGK